jgi:hypothetical protein
VKVSGAYLKLEFISKQGQAVVSNIMIASQRSSAKNQAKRQVSRKRTDSACISSSHARCPNCPPQLDGASRGYER